MKEDSKKSVNQFTVTKFSDICDKIIPFLEKYPLLFSPPSKAGGGKGGVGLNC
jgi:hypothetical protein